MNIVVVVAFFEPLYGGGERQLRYLCDELISRGHNVKLLTLGIPNCPSVDIFNGVHLLRFGSCVGKISIIEGYKKILLYLSDLTDIDIVYFIPNPQLAVSQQANILFFLNKIGVTQLVAANNKTDYSSKLVPPL